MSFLSQNMKLGLGFSFISAGAIFKVYESSVSWYKGLDIKPCEKVWFSKFPLPNGRYSYEPYYEEPPWEPYDDITDS